MTWWSIALPILIGTAVVMLPGLVVAYAARLRGVTAWGLAPGLSMTAYAVLGIAYGIPHATWSAATVAIGMVVLIAVVAFVARLFARRFGMKARPDPRMAGWAALVAIVVALVVVGIRFAFVFGSPDAVSQTFDANFHLNGVRYILDTGEASPFTFADLQYAFHGFGSFYPNLWHLVASLITELSGASIPVAANAFSIVISGVIWPLSSVFLLRQLLGPRPAALLAGGLLSVCFAGFPMALISWGVLYPNLLGLALVPAGLGALVLATRLATRASINGPWGWAAFVLLLPGIALAHPNAFVSLLGLGLPVLVAGGWVWFRRARASAASRRSYVVGALITVVTALVYAGIFAFVRPPLAAATWGPILGGWGAIYDALLNAEFGAPALVVSGLALIGVVAVLVKRRNRWLIASAAIVELLFFLTAYLQLGMLRYFFTGTWYGDVYRVIALFPVALTPLAAIGLVWLGELAARGYSRMNRDARLSTAAVASAASITLLAMLGVVAQFGPSMTNATGWAHSNYQLDQHSKLLTSDEKALIERVPGEVPADAIIAGDPWTGTSLVWALVDRRALAPHIYGARTPGANLILNSLRSARAGSQVCRAVKSEHVTYALDFGTKGVFAHAPQNPGVHHLATSSAVTLVDHVGKAALYRVTACG